MPKAGDELELYDVLADPREGTNVAHERPDHVATLRKKLDAWWGGD